MKCYIAVVGAGVNGLSTAVQILEANPPGSVHVTIIADKFERETTSDGAAGTFRPTMDYTPGVPRDVLRGWSQDSWDFYSKLANSEEASEAGVAFLSGYHYFSPGMEQKDYMHIEIVNGGRKLEQKEFHIFPGTSHCTSGLYCSTVLVESRWYLPWLLKRFIRNGGSVEKRTVYSMEELSSKYDIVVNCTGSRANELVDDDKIKPIRGQMIRVKAPWIKHFLYVDHNCWIIPGKETVTVGGTRQEGNTSLEVSESDSKAMWDRACTYMPSLKRAEWMWQWVGMRPTRTPVRLEKENMTFGQKTITVVHNYGHAGNGIALSWGCSKQAARLVQESLLQTMSRM